MYGFLQDAWQSLTSAEKSTWTTQANKHHISNFNAYIQVNVTRWANFLPPSKTYPVPAIQQPQGVTVTTWTPIRRGAKLVYSAISPQWRWGFAIFRSQTNGFTISQSNAIGFMRYETTVQHILYDAPLNPGTYYYRIRSFSHEGTWGLTGSQRTVTVPQP